MISWAVNQKLSSPVYQGKFIAFFENGYLSKMRPNNRDVFSDARYSDYIVIGDRIYDMNCANDIRAIPVPNFGRVDTMSGDGSLGSLDYVLRMMAGGHFDDGEKGIESEKELCSALLWKSTELMLANDHCGWSHNDFNRLIDWHFKLKMFDEGRKAVEYLESQPRYTENTFDQCAKGIIKYVIPNAISYTNGLVMYSDLGHPCCGECAKMIGRVYTVKNGLSKYPKLPNYARAHGNFHPGCRCSITAFSPDFFYVKGKKANPFIASHRPYVDDRTEEQKRGYQDYLDLLEKEKQEEIDRRIYYFLLEVLPEELIPKTFGAFRRIKNSNSKKYQRITEYLQEKNIKL